LICVRTQSICNVGYSRKKSQGVKKLWQLVRERCIGHTIFSRTEMCSVCFSHKAVHCYCCAVTSTNFSQASDNNVNIFLLQFECYCSKFSKFTWKYILILKRKIAVG
jgi:hypothetical protein